MDVHASFSSFGLESAPARAEGVKAAVEAGMSMSDILALVTKYGPVALDVLKYVVDRLRAATK